MELRAGAWFSFSDSDLDIPPNIDLEDDLDLDTFAVEPDVSLLWRFTKNRKHRLAARYFSLRRDGTETISFTLDLPNLPPISAGATVASRLDLHVLSVNYGYAFLQDARKELGLELGLDFIFADTQVSILGVPIEADLLDDGFGVPFPALGGFWNWAFAERFALRTRVDAFGLKIDDLTGALLKGGLGIDWAADRHVTFSLGYEVVGGLVSIKGSLDNFNFVSHGPQIAVTFRF